MTGACTVTSADSIPILSRADTLVVDGTLAGCIAAHALACGGRRIILAASACSLPYEMSVCRRPWVSEQEIERLPEAFASAFRESISHEMDGGEFLLNLSRLAIQVEDLLLDAGALLFYGMTPCGIVRASDQSLSAVVFGGKFGIQAITADSIIDCTPASVVTTLAGRPPKRRPCVKDQVVVGLSAKVGVADDDAPITEDRGQRSTCPTAWPEESVLSVPDVQTLVGGRIELHGPYAEFVLRLPANMDDPFWYSQLSNAAREHLVQIGSRIVERRAPEGKHPMFFHRFSGGLLTEPTVRIRAASRSEPCRPFGLDNVWVCGPAADVDDEEARRLADPYGSGRLARDIAEKALKQRVGPRQLQDIILTTVKPDDTAALSGALRFRDAPPLHAAGEGIPLGDLTLPVVAECDVLVAGAGTSGVPAALAAAESGARTILIEQQADVGGVRTTGGVASYWFGRETPYQRACDDAYDKCCERSGMAEEVAMLHCLLDAGVEVLTHCPTVGVVREGDSIIGAIIVTDRGLGIVRGSVIVDATGDADLAAWAGAPFEYGNGRDAWTMWASFANFNQEKRTASRHYDSAIEVRDPYDFIRTVITGRRRQGMWRRFAHEMPQHYVAPRESRRIEGRATVTYGGILAEETFPDVMVVCESNCDIKGIASSDLICCGVIWGWRAHKKYRAPIPYRAILPEGVGNLLVAGRTYAASHDALALARMQRDMVSLGAAAGMAAALSAATGTPPSQLDIGMLQEEWVRRGTLRKEDLRRYGKQPETYTVQDAERDARGLLSSSGRRPRRLARLMRSNVSIAPLRRAFDAAPNRSVKAKIARALCYLGDGSAVPFLLDVIAQQTENSLPRPYRRTLAIPPEHGWAPEPAYSLYAIGLAGRGGDAAHVMEAIAGKIEDNAERFAAKRESEFEYVKVICAVAERNPGPEMMPPLEVLLGKSCVRGLAIPYDGDMRLSADPVLERRAYLEVCLGRALARCADRRGYDILLGYVDDVRGPLARSAAVELADLLGEPLERNRSGWKRLIDRQAGALSPKPFVGRIE